MAEGLKITVDADVQKANAGLAKVTSNIGILEKQFERLQKLASMPNLSFRQQERLNSLLLSTQNELAKSKRAFDNVNPALVKYQRTTSSATQATLNFGRVIQDAPFGILGVANNINPLVESFQRLKIETGSSSKAFKALGSSLLGAGGIGLAVSAVTSALILFGDGLFGSGKKAEQSTEQVRRFKGEIEDLSNSVKNLGSDIQFFNQLGALNVKIAGFGDLQDLREQSVAESQLIVELNDKRAAAEKKRQQISAAQFNARGKELEDLLAQEKEAVKARSEIDVELNEADKRQRIIFRRIALQKITDQKELNDKEKAAWEKYVNDTIARGKELAQFFEGRRVVPNFTIFDSQSEAFQKAQRVISEFEQGSMKLIFRPQVEVQPVLVRTPETLTAIQQSLRDLESSLKADVPDLKLNISAAVTTTLAANNAEIEKFRKNLEQLASLGEFVGNKLADGFQGVFEAIASGESVIKAFGNAIKEVVADLIQAALRALIVRTITNLFAPGLGSVGRAGSLIGGGIPGFAAGGIVSGPTLAMVGEGVGTSRSNPEIIAPLDQLRAMLGDMGGGGEVIVINSRLRGRDQRLQASRENRSQRRTTGR